VLILCERISELEIEETLSVKEEISLTTKLFVERVSIYPMVAYISAELIVFDTMAEVDMEETFRVREEISLATMLCVERFSMYPVFAYI
jgi:hypothetical protein